MDPCYEPELVERRTLFGLVLEQTRNHAIISKELFANAVTDKKEASVSCSLFGAADD